VLQHDDKVAILARNPGYPGPRTAAYDHIAVELYRDVGESIQQVDAGDLDVVLMPPGGEFRDLATTWGPGSQHAMEGDQRWHGVPGPSTLFLALNRTAGPLKDPTVRRAFQLAIDRRAAAAVWRENPIGRLFPPAVPASGVDVVPTDGSGIDAARELMDGRRVTLRYAYVEPCDACASFASALAAPLGQVGITLVAHGVTADECGGVFCDPSAVWRYDVVDGVAQARYPDAWSMLSILPQVMPEPWITDADRTAIQGMRTLSGAERDAAAIAFAERFVRDDAALVPISYADGSAYIGPGVHCRVMQPTLTAVDLANLCP
jgi:ABC-type transport system substrate-binding protein